MISSSSRIPSTSTSFVKKYFSELKSLPFFLVSAGPGRLNPYTGVRVENNVKPGDRVIFNIGTALPVTVTKKKGNDFNSEKYFFTNDVEVDGILDEDEII
jgi:hypothetical protein